jgi:hypothetical protein
MKAADFSNPMAYWIGHIVRRNCLLKHAIEGKLQGRIWMMGRWWRRRRQLLNDLREREDPGNRTRKLSIALYGDLALGETVDLHDKLQKEWMNDVNAERPYYTELYSINIGGFCTIKIQLVFDGCSSWSYCLQHNWMDHITIKQMS